MQGVGLPSRRCHPLCIRSSVRPPVCVNVGRSSPLPRFPLPAPYQLSHTCSSSGVLGAPQDCGRGPPSEGVNHSVAQALASLCHGLSMDFPSPCEDN